MCGGGGDRYAAQQQPLSVPQAAERKAGCILSLQKGRGCGGRRLTHPSVACPDRAELACSRPEARAPSLTPAGGCHRLAFCVSRGRESVELHER